MAAKAVILVSGGMDSTVAAALVRQAYEPCFLHIGYGQKTQSKERECVRRIGDYYHIRDYLDKTRA